MLKKICLAAALAVTLPAFAADYYVVVPLPGKAPTINVALEAATLPAAVQNRGYSYNLAQLLSVTGDDAYDASKVTWAVASGALPAGISLSPAGVLQGVGGALNAGAAFRASATYKGAVGSQDYQLIVKSPDIIAELSGAAGSTTAPVTDFGAKSISNGMVMKYVYLRNVGEGGVLSADIALTSSAEAGVWKLQSVRAVNYENNGDTANCAGSGNAVTGCKAQEFTYPGSAKELRAEVWFDPVSVGTRTATLTFTHNGTNASPVSVTLTGEGTEPQPVAELSGSAGSTTAVTTDFGQKAIADGMVMKYVYLRNVGGQGVLTSDVSLSSTAEAGVWKLQSVVAVNYENNGGSAYCTGAGNALTQCKAADGSNVYAAKELRAEVWFDPSVVGTRSATLTFNHNGSNASPVSVTLTGEGIEPTPTAELSGSAGATTAIDPSFGSRTVGTGYASKYVYLRNVAINSSVLTSNVALTSSAESGVFTIGQVVAVNYENYANSAGCSGAGNALTGCKASVSNHATAYKDLRVEVRFNPVAAGARDATLTFTHNGTSSPTSVTLTGTGAVVQPVAAVSTTNLQFGSKAVSSWNFAYIYVSNTSGGALSANWTVTGSTAFAVNTAYTYGSTGYWASCGSLSSCTATTDPKSKDIRIEIRYRPMTAGEHTGTLTINHNGSNTSPIVVNLGGSAL